MGRFLLDLFANECSSQFPSKELQSIQSNEFQVWTAGAIIAYLTRIVVDKIYFFIRTDDNYLYVAVYKGDKFIPILKTPKRANFIFNF